MGEGHLPVPRFELNGIEHDMTGETRVSGVVVLDQIDTIIRIDPFTHRE